MTEPKPPNTSSENADPFSGLPVPPAKAAYAIPEDCDFSTVGEPFMSNECSPVINHTFKGFLINMPKEHYYQIGEKTLSGAFTFLPVCGAYRVANGELPGDKIEDAILLVAVDTKTRDVYTGRYAIPGVEIPMPEKFRDLDDDIPPPGTYIGGGNFNYNLPAVVRLPEKPAEYIVYVIAGPYKSNVRTVKVMKKK